MATPSGSSELRKLRLGAFPLSTVSIFEETGERSVKPAALLSGLFLLLIALAHLCRLVFNVSLMVGDDVVVPMWPSVVAVLVPAALAIWLWREQRMPQS